MSKKKGNVLINGRTAVHAGSEGVLATVDVCLTKIGKKTVPIPYTNVARSADAANTASTVFINGHPVCHKKSIFAKSTGDEPGDRKGVRSKTIKGKAEFVTGSSNVFIEGIPAVRQGDLMVSNNRNTAPMPLSQPGAPRANEVKTTQVEELDATQLPNEVPLEASGGKLHIQNELAANTAAVHEVDPDDLEGAETEGNHATASLDTRDELYQFNTQKPIANLHDKDLKQKDFREIVLGAKEEDDEQDLWLKLLDLDANLGGKKGERNWINLYLGRSKTFERGKSPKKHNVVVPLIPRCYATADRDPAQAVEVPEGWLYIIRKFDSPQGTVVELWRELKSDGLGNFSDVNLKRFKGKDRRKATGQPGFRVIAPYCIDKQVHDLWIAYSKVQWSWARVQSMKKDSDLRARRMHKLDLSDCLDNFANSRYTAPPEQHGQKDKPEAKNVSSVVPPADIIAALGSISKAPAEDRKEEPPVVDLGEIVVEGVFNAAELYNLKSAPDPESRNLAEDFKEAIPVVYLDDPIGIGRRLAGEYQQQWQELSDCVKKLRAIPDYLKPKHEQPKHIRNSDSIDPEIRRMMAGPERYFEAAALANRYFYGKILKATPPGVKDPDAYQKRLKKIDKQFKKYQDKLDKPAIEQAIRAPQRRAIREKLVQARDKLVNFLREEMAAINPVKPEGETQDPPLVLALDDYFTLTPLGDWERKQNPNDAVGDKSTPRWRDNYLDGWGAVYDLVAFLGKHEYSLDADLEANPKDGWNWRRENPAFELLLNLADPGGGYPLHSRLFPKAAAGDALKVDTAKVEDTATAFKTQHLGNIELLKRRDADIAKGLHLFGSNLSELMAMRDKNDPAYEKSLKRARNSVLRLVQSAANLTLEEEGISLADLIAKAEKELEEDNSGGASILKVFEKTADFLNKSIKDATESPTTVKAADGRLGRTCVRIVAVVNKNQTVNLLRDLGDDRAVTCGLAGFLGLIKAYNFAQALDAFTSDQNDNRNWELFAPLASSFLKLPEAIKGVWDKVGAAEAAASGATKAAAQGALREVEAARATTKATGIEVFGNLAKKATLVAYLFDFGITLSSLTENLAQNDDAAIADVIGLSGITVGILSKCIYIPGAGWFFGLTLLAALLAKAFLFEEDTPVEIWINNGPFARGKEYHDQFVYRRSSVTAKVRDAGGQWVDTACTSHQYGNFSFLVNREGVLVHAGVVPPSPAAIGRPELFWPGALKISPCKVAPDGKVYLRANLAKGVPADTHVATVGERFTMPLLLKPAQETPPQALTVKQPATEVDNPYKMRKLPPSLLLNTAQSYKPDVSFWPHCHDAYLALADAIYRPRVTMQKSSGRQVQCVFNVKVPFYIPGKSKLYIEFTEKSGDTTKHFIPAIPANIKDLKVGPGEYEILRTIKPATVRTFEGKVRLELFGDNKVQLPFEPRFCSNEIEIDQNTVKGAQNKDETKWIIAKMKMSNPVDILTYRGPINQ